MALKVEVDGYDSYALHIPSLRSIHTQFKDKTNNNSKIMKWRVMISGATHF